MKIGETLTCTVPPEPLHHDGRLAVYKWRFHSCSTFPNCCAADQEEKAACSPITLPDYRLMARQKHNRLPNSPVVEEPSPSKRDTEARLQAHLARYRTLNTERAVAAARGNRQKQKTRDKNKKEGVEDSSRGLFRNGVYM